jgi:hypothetical protein
MTVSLNGTSGIVFNDASTQNTSAFTGGFAFRNRLINSDMRIDQRNAGASVTPTADATYTLDRWRARLSQASKYSVQQNAGSLSAANRPAGFTNYFGVTSLSAHSVVVSDYFGIEQPIEGFNIADLGWGTASAQSVTLSFWVRSSLTGTFAVNLNNNGGRSYPASYTINSANTWELKTISIAGDTSGTWGTTSGYGIGVSFGLGYGSNYQGTVNTWGGGSALSFSGATSVVGTSGATFYITGVQLEKGSTATSFDYRPYGTELALCQRYYEQTYIQYSGVAINTYNCDAVVYWVVDKRAAPSLAYTQATLNAFPVGDPTTRTNTVRYLSAYKGATSTTNGIWAYTLNASSEL